MSINQIIGSLTAGAAAYAATQAVAPSNRRAGAVTTLATAALAYYLMGSEKSKSKDLYRMDLSSKPEPAKLEPPKKNQTQLEPKPAPVEADKKPQRERYRFLTT